MNWGDIASTVGRAAPLLGTLLGGPAGAAVGGIIASALGTGNSASEVERAIAADPASLVRLREIEASRLKRFEELAAEQAKHALATAAADRASAREREAKTGDSFTPRTLALLVTAGFFGVLGWLLVAGKPTHGGDALLVMLGSLGTAWTAIISYYYGSSAGSAAKTELLRKQ